MWFFKKALNNGYLTGQKSSKTRWANDTGKVPRKCSEILKS